MENNGDVGKVDEPEYVEGGLPSLEYMDDMHLSMSSDSLSGVL